MSTFKAISRITEYLRDQLIDAAKAAGLGDSVVTVGPPDKARGDQDLARLNLFLYQVLPDAAWRNRDAPGKVKAGERAPLLPLRLGYLVTAFETPPDPEHPSESLGHSLLGCAMRRLHDNTELKKELEPESPAAELPRITLQPLSLDEMSKVWSGLQSPYRVTVAYEVSPVLIESTKPTQSAPPVLSRGESRPPNGQPTADDPGFPAMPGAAPAEITVLRFPPGQAGVRLKDELVLEGSGLDRVNVLEFRHASLSVTHMETPTFDRAAGQLHWSVPDDPFDPNDPLKSQWPAGLWSVTAGRRALGNDPDRREFTTSSLQFAVLPEILLDEVNGVVQRPRLRVHRDNQGNIDVVWISLRVRPRLVTGDNNLLIQTARILANGEELPMVAGVVDADTSTPRVEFRQKNSSIAAELYNKLKNLPADRPLFVRVKIDGADSSLLRLPFDPRTSAREYDPNLILVVP